MSGNSELPNDNQQAQDTGVSQGRRNLILASAAVPLVATLHSGAAMAASSALQCLGGDFSNKKFLENGNSINGDTAVRVEVPYFKRTGNNNASGYEGYPQNIYYIEGGFYNNGGDAFNCDLNKLRASNSPYKEEVAYVLVLVDENGQQLGPWPKYQLVNDGGIGNAITQSCWTSLMNSGSTSL